MKRSTAWRSATGTGPRFVLLMVLVTLSGVLLFDITLALLIPDGMQFAFRQYDCDYATGFDPTASDREHALQLLRNHDLLKQCAGERPWPRAGIVATTVMLAVAGAVYWYQPKFHAFRRASVPVEAADADGSLATELELLCTRAGLSPELTFRVDPARMTSGARVYGRTGSYRVHLHAGLLVLRGTDPGGFRAVVLHELAHVRHRDVDYASATTALWRVFVVTALIPYFAYFGYIFFLFTRHPDDPWLNGVPSAIGFVLVGLLLAGLVHLARADLLRRREFHADLRAVAWGADPASWRRPEPRGDVLPWWHRFTKLLRTHPSWEERGKVLADAGRLDRLVPVEMFLTGTAASLLYGAVAPVEAMVLGSAGLWVSDALVALAVCCALGVQTTRVLSRTDDKAESGLLPGAWLGLGLLVAQLAGSTRHRLDLVPSSPQYLLVFLLVATVPMVWWSQALKLLAGLPRLRRRVGLAVCASVAAATLYSGLRWWRLGGEIITLGFGDHAGALSKAYTSTIHGDWGLFAPDLLALDTGMSVLSPLHALPAVRVTAILLWLVPLVLLLLQQAQARAGIRRMLTAGLAGGLASWVVVAAVRYVMAARRPAGVHERTGAYLTISMWWLAVAVLAVCVVAGALVASFSRRFWVVRALVTAQVVQLIAYGGVFFSFAADGCLGPANSVLDTCRWNTHNGATVALGIVRLTLSNAVLAAACAAVLGAGGAWLVRRWRAHPGTASAPQPPPLPSSATPARRRRPALKAAAVLALCVPAVLLALVAQPRPNTGAYGRAVAQGLAGSGRSSDDQGPPAQVAPGAGGREPRPESSPEDPAVQRLQMRAWLRNGGHTRVQGFDNAVTLLYREIHKARVQGKGKEKLTIDEDDFHELCGDLGKQTERVQDYLPVPDRELQRAWSAALSRVMAGVQDCQDAFYPPKGALRRTMAERGQDFADSLHEIVAGVDDVTAAFGRIAVDAGAELANR